MHLLDPKNDRVFQLLLTRRTELLVDMVQGILARPVQEVKLLNSEVAGEQSTDKQIRLDIRAVLDDGSRVDLEMQMRTHVDLESRLVFYTARDYADQLRKGDGYDRLTPTATIVWLVEPLSELEEFHLVFELRERHANTRLSTQMEIHLLQLPYRPQTATAATGYTASVERWARFLTARTEAEFEQLAAEDPIMRIAKDTLDELSMDPEARRQAREREDSIKLYEMSIRASEARGEAQGIVRGQARVVLKQLELCFGPLPGWVCARVESATAEQLDRWVERVLTATSLDEVFDVGD